MNLPLTDISVIKKLLQKRGTAPKRAMGQNFLICPEVVEASVEVLRAGPPIVTELGAGLGALTQGLLAADFTVRAIEKDDELARTLQKELQKKFPLEVIHDDLQSVDWAHEKPYQIAGNIPYNLSGLIIRRIVTAEPTPAQALLLVQEEVAKRILAEPPQMSMLSLAVQLWGGATMIMRVPPSCFWPQPRVSSALIVIECADPYPEREKVLQLARRGFQEKRKQLSGTLRRNSRLTDTQLDAVFQTCGLAENVRPQELSAKKWIALYEAVVNPPV